MDYQLVLGKMKNKIFVIINNFDDIKRLKELGINNYVYPLKDYCVGIPNTFFGDEIKEDGYLLINRILDNKGIDELKVLLNNLNNNIKGIIFDDLGILNIIKDLNMEKILNLTHFNCNSKSINIYLDMVDTVILPTDITKDEIEYIINNVKKEISLITFGYVPCMYSRRLLIDNYSKYYNINKNNPLVIKNDDIEFLVYENEFGTVFYYNKVFNGLELMKLNAKYFFFNSMFLDIKDIDNVLKGIITKDSSEHFLNKETIYKLKDGE